MPNKQHTQVIVQRDYILNVHDGTSELIHAMRKVMFWQKLREVCLSRTKCKGCPYYTSGVCERSTTEDILKEARTVFKQYLIEI